MTSLFDPLRFGDINVANRIVMAPLTRNRAAAHQVPSALAVQYYTQRASAGLIVTEASQISPEGQGYLDTPGIHSPEQVAAWRQVTDAVHAQGGRIVIQLWHVGRISHVSLQPGGIAPVSSTARTAVAKTFTSDGFVDTSTPRALRLDEMPRIVADYRHAARCAMQAGFDGVEVHGSNGYLLDQFLRSGSNHRSDAYGGAIQNRARLLVEVMQAIVQEIGGARVGLRLSPVTPSNDAFDPAPQPLFEYVVRQLGPLQLAYLHLIEGATGAARDHTQGDQPFDYAALRKVYHSAGGSGAWMVNNGYDRPLADQSVAEGADLVAFGKLFIANPDLPRRLREGAPLNTPDRTTFYGGTEKGYTDYPALA